MSALRDLVDWASRGEHPEIEEARAELAVLESRRALTVEELMAALQVAAVVQVGREYGTAKLIAEAMDTSDGQVRNLINGRAGDLRLSTVERAVKALGTLEGKRLRLRLLVEEEGP